MWVDGSIVGSSSRRSRTWWNKIVVGDNSQCEHMEHRATFNINTSPPMHQTAGYIHSGFFSLVKQANPPLATCLYASSFASLIKAEKRTSRVTSIELPNRDTIYVENPPYGERNDYLERKTVVTTE